MNAPQPLLVAFGSLLGDIDKVDVYQLRREIPGETARGWRYESEMEDEVGWSELMFEEPGHKAAAPALVLSLSGTIDPSRIKAVLGDDASIWHVSVPEPHNDVVVRRSQVRAFRQVIRKVLDRVKHVHGQETVLHVFPAMPVSIAIELGRVRMPKAEMPWRIYDQLPKQGFVPVLNIIGDDVSPLGAAK